MKKASKIVLTIGAIWNLILTIGCAVTGLVLCIVALVGQGNIVPIEYYEFVQDILDSFEASVDVDVIIWISIGVYCLAMLTLFFVLFVFALVATILAFNGAKAKKNGILIANIIFGFFLENWIVIVGAILGIVGLSIEKKRAENAQAEPVKEVEQNKPISMK